MAAEIKRLCIYVIYDKQKKINKYIEPVLRELKRFVTDIVIVCNFDKIAEGEEYILSYASEIYFRDNVGFDAGAYKDALIDLITWDRALCYDELLLTNDTYFGPVYPFDEMFGRMGERQCDFWGITRNSGGFIEDIGEFDEHVQSYFLNFKGEVFHSRHFKDFWDAYQYMPDKIHTVVNFEIGINTYLTGRGYKGHAYTDDCCLPYMDRSGVNPYFQYAYELIRDVRVPVIKKTSFYGKNRWLLNALTALEYIEEHTGYDVSLIKDYICEYQKKGLIGPYFDFEAMERFVGGHSDVYIYGCGVWGQITADYFKKKGLTYKCFLVTEGADPDTGVRRFLDVDIAEDDGIIIAQEYRDVCEEIIRYIGERCDKGQIFTPCYVQEAGERHGADREDI